MAAGRREWLWLSWSVILLLLSVVFAAIVVFGGNDVILLPWWQRVLVVGLENARAARGGVSLAASTLFRTNNDDHL